MCSPADRWHNIIEARAPYASHASPIVFQVAESSNRCLTPLRIEPIAGYSPTIGRLVGMVVQKINAHWAWFHVAEDEINHRGQMRWLRARLPQL